MNVKPKLIVSQKVHGVAESHSRTLLKTRDLIDVSDEPVERGGTNEGFAPTEFMLAGLVACTNVVFHKIAAKHGVEIEKVLSQSGTAIIEDWTVTRP